MLSHPPSIVRTFNPLQSLIARRWRPQWVCQRCRYDIAPRRALATTTSTASVQEQNTKPYYVTTPIFYVNAAPHVGHMYTMVLADVLKRWQVLKGRDARLLTGTDEHGMKIQRAAAKAGVPPKEFCDHGAEIFKDLAAKINMSNDTFIRTTDPHHKSAVEHAWHLLKQHGHIYEKKHEGWYSVSDETFYPQSQVSPSIDPMSGVKRMSSNETGKEVEWTSERNYHFRLSDFRERLLAFYKENPTFILPAARMNDVISQVEAGLGDLSISRPYERLSWGIRVPTDDSQTIYVWLDALLNYASAAGFPFHPDKTHEGGWPPDVQIIGKDIVRFHCIYWPAMLMALGLPLPKQILTHAHWTLGKEKMAKSTGNVVDPFFALERFGIDVMRWYLVHDGGIANDSDYDNTFIIRQYKKYLQGGLGNLLLRVVGTKRWSARDAVIRCADKPREKVTAADAKSDSEHETVPDVLQAHKRRKRLVQLKQRLDQRMENCDSKGALKLLMEEITTTNAYLQEQAPWTVRQASVKKHGRVDEESQAAVDAIIYNCLETLRITGILLQPFMPEASQKQLDILGVAKDRRTWEWCMPAIDNSYGTPMVDMEVQSEYTLFPGLSSEY